MAKNNFRDPRGHSLRIYSDLYDSPAFAALSPHDVLAYLALLRELKQHNNGDLSLTLSRAKKCGIKHHITLARSLRALCAVGLIAITRKGGSSKDGQRLPSLYRVTDRECYEIPAKHLSALPATNEWKSVTSEAQGQQLIADAERKAEQTAKPKSAAIRTALEKKSLGHAVTVTRTPREMKSATTRTPHDIEGSRPGHGVTMAEKAENSITTRVCAGFDPPEEKEGHRTPRVPPLHIATPGGEMGCSLDAGNQQENSSGHTKTQGEPTGNPRVMQGGQIEAMVNLGTYKRLTAKPLRLFTSLLATPADSAPSRNFAPQISHPIPANTAGLLAA